MDIGQADWLRMVLVALALALVPLCMYCVAFSDSWDQGMRFGVLAGYGAVTVAEQLNALGRPITWVTLLLVVVTVAALAATVPHVAKARRDPA